MENKKYLLQYLLQICFNTMEELEECENKLKQFNNNPGQKIIIGGDQPINKIDKRGSKTKEMHQKVKKYLESHPDEKYKDVLKKVKKI